MKKLILLFLVLVLKFAPAKAQWVTIPDPNFVTKLQQLFPTCMNGNQMDTTCAGVVNATSLDISFLNISNVFGVQFFDNLIEFHSFQNQLTTLPSLPAGLQVLECISSQLISLPQLPATLTVLNCMSNQLTTLPPLPPGLTSLSCSYNQLTSLPLVPAFMNWFYIDNNDITCLTNLPIVTDTSNASIFNNPFTCVPNQTDYSFYLDTSTPYALCLENDPVNNPNNCVGVNIIGKVYTDLNGNCLNNTTDLSSQNIPVKLFDNQNNFITQSNVNNGYYSFAGLQQNSYQVIIDLSSLPISIACGQSNVQSVSLSSSSQTIQNINFPILCSLNYDLFIQAVTPQGWVFPGQIHTLRTNVSNSANWFNLVCNENSYSGIVSIQVNGPVSFAAPAPGALTPTVSGNTFTYSISNFNNLNPNSFGLRLITDTTAQATDQICVHVEVSPNPTDADTSNNVYDFCYNVINSYDPNMKEVYPVNVLPGYDDWFTYTIHFQNTGNAPAFNIRLRDTLDTQLDLNTFEVLGYSHPANVTVSGNILTVRFNDIMLPDSTSDYEGSMGYFQYRIKPTPNLPNGSQISNTAYIYFDYNAPIITNTTENNFDMTVPVKSIVTTENSFSLFPNPSTGVFTFKDAKNIHRIEVYNLMGQEIAVFVGDNTNKVSKQINLSNQNKGIYFAKINGSVVLKLVKE
jgi:uncharacterized repeat protein (TIGR01451 family)